MSNRSAIQGRRHGESGFKKIQVFVCHVLVTLNNSSIDFWKLVFIKNGNSSEMLFMIIIESILLVRTIDLAIDTM